MYPRFKTNFIKNCVLSKNGIVIAAVSGGIDSMVMLDLFSRLARNMPLEIHVAHVNYMLRGRDSDADEALVRRAAGRLGMPCSVLKKKPGSGANLQDEARRIRYDFFSGLMRRHNANLIAVAHNMNDQAETMLLHLIRGSGLSGLAGMRPFSSADGLMIARPLLPFTRDEIRVYARERGIKYREDKSNLRAKYARNALRLSLIPLLQKFNSRIVRILANTGRLISEEDEAISLIAGEAFGQALVKSDSSSIEMSRDSFIHLPVALRKRVLRVAFARLAGSAKDLNSDQLEKMDSMSIRELGEGSYRLPSSCRFIRRGELLIVRREKTNCDR